jgi:hypothetical protein
VIVRGAGQIGVVGATVDGPVVAAAMIACASDLPPSGAMAPIGKAERLTMIARAKCLRRHDVPSFPDPTFPASGGVELNLSINPEAPAFRAAVKACQNADGQR